MTADSDKAFTLIIESGLHAGTVQRLSQGLYTIGSELDADVVLSDPAVASIHLILELDRHGLRLEPVQGSASIDGESVALEPGGERNLVLPASFTIGDTRIKLTAPQDAVRNRRRVRMAAIAAGTILLAVLGFQLVGAFSGADPNGPSAAFEQPQPASQLENEQATLEASIADGSDQALATGDDLEERAPPSITHDQAAEELRSRLAAAELSDIDVTSNADRILVRGGAEPDKMADWQDVRMWFDGAFGQQFIMVADVKEAKEERPPRLAIEAIWLGDKPYVMAGGQRFHVGAAIGDGWMVEHIGSDEITFKRGDKSFSLSL
jgi:hypothetical protein